MYSMVSIANNTVYLKVAETEDPESSHPKEKEVCNYV